MAQRRVNEVAFNFDSLTDMVTNLAGGLILIVLQLIAVNHERTSQAGKVAERTARDASTLSGSSLEFARLRNEADILEQDMLPRFEAQIRKTQDDVAKLRREIDAKQPREAADPRGKPGVPSLVELRPPKLSRNDNLRTGAFIVVDGKRVFFLNLPEFLEKKAEIEEEFKNACRQSTSLKDLVFETDRDLRSGDFNVHFRASEITADAMTLRFKGGPILVRKPGAVGETEDQALSPGSDYMSLAKRLDPKESAFSFAVFPDSFELFLKLRKEILKQDKSFRYNWGPLAAGEELSIGSGGGVQ